MYMCNYISSHAARIVEVGERVASNPQWLQLPAMMRCSLAAYMMPSISVKVVGLRIILLHSLFAENEGMTQLVDEWQQLRLTAYLGSPCLHGDSPAVLPGLLQ